VLLAVAMIIWTPAIHFNDSVSTNAVVVYVVPVGYEIIVKILAGKVRN
jgi:hypothetical protein